MLVIVIVSSLWILDFIDEKSQFNSVQFTETEQAWLDSKPIITVAIDPIFAPYEYIENERHKGLTMDYLSYLEAEYNVTFEIVQDSSWLESYDAFKNGEIDILSAVAQTPQRDALMLFTEPYTTIQNVVLIRNDFSKDFTEVDLSSMHVAVIEGYFAQDLLELHFPGIQLYKAVDIEDGLRALSFGRVDAFVTDSAQASYYIPKVGVNNLTMNDNIQLGFDLNLNIGVTKAKPELRNILSKMIVSIPDDIHAEIREWWMTPAYQPGINQELLWVLTGLGLLILISGILVSLWHRTLNAQVHIRTDDMKKELIKRETVQTQLKAVIHAIPYPVSMKNSFGEYVYVNKAYADLVGLELEFMISNTDTSLPLLDHEELKVFLSTGDDVVLEQNKMFKTPAQTLLLNGQEKVYEITKLPFSIREGEPFGILSFSFDISEQYDSQIKLMELNDHLEDIVEIRINESKLKNSELNKSLAQLRESESILTQLNDELNLSVEVLNNTESKLIEVEKFAALGRAASGVAHEMNTPLGVGISASSYGLSVITDLHQDLKEKLPFTKTTIQPIDRLDESLRLVQTSIERILLITGTLSNITTDNWGDGKEQVNLEKVIRQIYKDNFENSNIQLHLECDDTINLTVSESAMNSMFLHLFKNALDHGFVAYKQPHTILIRCALRQNNLHIHFEDNGIGVDPKILPGVIEPLFTSKRGSSHLGLGLSIIYNVVVRHFNGKLNLYNLDEGGLAVDIGIPLDAVEHSAGH